MSELREAIKRVYQELAAHRSGELRKAIETTAAIDPWLELDALATVLAAARKYADLEDMVAEGARVVVEYPCEHGHFSGHLVSGERCAGGVPRQAMPEWCSCVPGGGGIMDVEGCPTHNNEEVPDG